MELKADWATFPKHYSTWLGVAAIIFDSVYVFTDALALSPQTVVLINAAVPVGMKILQLLKQSIPVAPDVKEEMKDTLEDLPTKTESGAVVHHASQPEPRALHPTSQKTTRDQVIDLIREEIARDKAKPKPRKPRKPKTPTQSLAAQFNPPQES